MFAPEGFAVKGRPKKGGQASNVVQFPASKNRGGPSFELRYADSFFADSDLRIGGRAGAGEGSEIDRTVYRWRDVNGEAYWEVLKTEQAHAHALQWLKSFCPNKCSAQGAKSASITATLLASESKEKWVNTSQQGTVIGVRGAYLRLVTDEAGKVSLKAEKPSKDVGLTYVVPAVFDASRVAADGTYTPRPVSPSGAFGKYLNLFMPDLDVRGLLQEAVGSTVLSRTFEKCFWLQGEGSNGKSTLLHILRQLHPRNQALSLRHLDGRFAMTQLVGATLATVSECPDFLGGDVEQIMKAIVSRDPISVEEKSGGYRTIVPRASLFLAINKALRVTDHSYGFWSKVLPIPFLVQMDRFSNERVVDYHKLITENPEEMAQVLDWVLEGAVRLESRGNFPNPLPAAVQALARTQKYAADNVLQYIEDNSVRHDPEVRTKRQDVYQDYNQFCLNTNVKAVQNNEFWTRLYNHLGKNSDDMMAGQVSEAVDSKKPRLVYLHVNGVKPYARSMP
ncbi:MAG: hypothetical protein J0I77_01840 [Rudaea sp.]|uniref:DNA primase family protein n=1 Tax=unclassified Rudaea TaxID=2627037 RepID=UPI0010F6D612|nr:MULTISPECIES: DUF5906 domain-containing protein [unclassified Rudaea]MBN8884436.1 hypothetical protein [Rudaea sp.]